MIVLMLLAFCAIAVPLCVDYERNTSRSQVAQAGQEVAEMTREAIGKLQTHLDVKIEGRIRNLFLAFIATVFAYVWTWLKSLITGGTGRPGYRS